MTNALTNSIPHMALAGGADPALRKKEVAALIGVSVATLDRMVGRAEFPVPLELSRRRIGWRLCVVQAWLASRPARAGRAEH